MDCCDPSVYITSPKLGSRALVRFLVKYADNITFGVGAMGRSEDSHELSMVSFDSLSYWLVWRVRYASVCWIAGFRAKARQVLLAGKNEALSRVV